jgi:hypothetical protein
VVTTSAGTRLRLPRDQDTTCATPEDHARGNYWSDRFHNPEHRIDKIGVLVDVRRANVSPAGARE